MYDEPVMKEFKRLSVDQTPKAPQIDLDQFTGELIFSGKSIPENAYNIYEPVLHWINTYVQNPRPTTNLRLNLDYFNTDSSIWLSKIFKEIGRAHV